MGTSDESETPKAEERTSPEEKLASVNAEERQGTDQHVVGELSDSEKQKLFMKKLYRLSQTYIEEIPEEERAKHTPPRKIVSTIASPLSQATEENDESVAPPKPSALITLAKRLSEMTSCISMDSICAGKDSDEPPKREVKPKKKSPLLRNRPDIPQTITLAPNHVSRLEDDDSLARHINALARKTPQPDAVDIEDASHNSPQCVAELSYEMEISRVIPKQQDNKVSSLQGSLLDSPKRRRFTAFEANHAGIKVDETKR